MTGRIIKKSERDGAAPAMSCCNGPGRIRTGDLHCVWADVSFRYEKYADVDSSQELSRYLLKFGRVNGVYEDEEITYEVKRTVAGMLRDGVPRRQVVEETSALYGIPEECVVEVVAAVPEGCVDEVISAGAVCE